MRPTDNFSMASGPPPSHCAMNYSPRSSQVRHPPHLQNDQHQPTTLSSSSACNAQEWFCEAHRAEIQNNRRVLDCFAVQGGPSPRFELPDCRVTQRSLPISVPPQNVVRMARLGSASSSRSNHAAASTVPLTSDNKNNNSCKRPGSGSEGRLGTASSTVMTSGGNATCNNFGMTSSSTEVEHRQQRQADHTQAPPAAASGRPSTAPTKPATTSSAGRSHHLRNNNHSRKVIHPANAPPLPPPSSSTVLVGPVKIPPPWESSRASHEIAQRFVDEALSEPHGGGGGDYHIQQQPDAPDFVRNLVRALCSKFEATLRAQHVESQRCMSRLIDHYEREMQQCTCARTARRDEERIRSHVHLQAALQQFESREAAIAQEVHDVDDKIRDLLSMLDDNHERRGGRGPPAAVTTLMQPDVAPLGETPLVAAAIPANGTDGRPPPPPPPSDEAQAPPPTGTDGRPPPPPCSDLPTTTAAVVEVDTKEDHHVAHENDYCHQREYVSEAKPEGVSHHDAASGTKADANGTASTRTPQCCDDNGVKGAVATHDDQPKEAEEDEEEKVSFAAVTVTVPTAPAVLASDAPLVGTGDA